MIKLKSALIVLLLGLTTAVVVGLFLLTLALPSLIPRLVCTPYGIRCAVGQITIRPHLNLTMDLVIDHLTLFDPQGRETALRVKRLAATLGLPSVIRTGEVMPTEVRIEHPELLLRQLDDGRWNLQVLAQEVQRHVQPAARSTALRIPRVSLAGGVVQIGNDRVADIHVTLGRGPLRYCSRCRGRPSSADARFESTAR
ncbi:MAG: AsmA family protein [Candidatus Methylomirabilis sp.]|nr:AsmA family protein [Candidatus Methylomirabilis sp.]